MTLFGGTIRSVAYVSQGGLTANQSETRIAVTFTADTATARAGLGRSHREVLTTGADRTACPRFSRGIDGFPVPHAHLCTPWAALTIVEPRNTDRSDGGFAGCDHPQGVADE